jgi:predicted O-methyltransferase YrrM
MRILRDRLSSSSSSERTTTRTWLLLVASNGVTCMVLLAVLGRTPTVTDFYATSLVSPFVEQQQQQQQVVCASPTTPPHEPQPQHVLEQVMYKYGSDKSHDDHGYTDFYQMIFDPIRHHALNITEVGVSAGQSIQAFYQYFTNSHLYAFDMETPDSLARIVQQRADRVHYQQVNLLQTDDLRSVGLYKESMDVLIEDAMHAPWQQQQFLVKLFPLVKPGGYYIIEDIAYTNLQSRDWHENIEALPRGVQDILHNHDAIFIDTHIGHRAWDLWKSRTSNAKDHVVHNSYLLVIRKRYNESPPVKMNLGDVAMRPNKVVLDEEKNN